MSEINVCVCVGGEVGIGFTEDFPQIGLEDGMRVATPHPHSAPFSGLPEELEMLVMIREMFVGPLRVPIRTFFSRVGFTSTSEQGRKWDSGK